MCFIPYGRCWKKISKAGSLKLGTSEPIARSLAKLLPRPQRWSRCLAGCGKLAEVTSFGLQVLQHLPGPYAHISNYDSPKQLFKNTKQLSSQRLLCLESSCKWDGITALFFVSFVRVTALPYHWRIPSKSSTNGSLPSCKLTELWKILIFNG